MFGYQVESEPPPICNLMWMSGQHMCTKRVWKALLHMKWGFLRRTEQISKWSKIAEGSKTGQVAWGFIVVPGWHWCGSSLTQARAVWSLSFLLVLVELAPRRFTTCPDMEQKQGGRNKRGETEKLSAVKHQKLMELYPNSFLVFDWWVNHAMPNLIELGLI